MESLITSFSSIAIQNRKQKGCPFEHPFSAPHPNGRRDTTYGLIRPESFYHQSNTPS